MSLPADTDYVGYRLQTFERRLAELEATGATRKDHLAFFSRFAGGRTHQFYFDRFVKLRVPSDGSSLLREAEATRDGHRSAAHNYLTHGLHSYKGKYFPQIVRALLNSAGMQAEASVVDPFVGSGTTCLEASLMGYRSHGVDQNPLAALIARTKVAALHLEPSEIPSMMGTIIDAMNSDHSAEVPNADYLKRWFPPANLDMIARILGAIDASATPQAMRDVARLTLSALLRAWSLQEPTQLRIFRRHSAPDAASLYERFKADLDETVRGIIVGSALLSDLGITMGAACVTEGDARNHETWHNATFDALVTSPPYATALPYIDTDRLSIYALGLADVRERSDLEWLMVGNREIRKRQRNELEDQLERNDSCLPDQIATDILTIKHKNEAFGVGFRRENLPALLYRYFADMQTVLDSARIHLRPKALTAIIVGDSFTVAGDQRFRIRTSDFLCLTAAELGYEVIERIGMGGQAAYLPHQRNTIPSEEILILRSPRRLTGNPIACRYSAQY